MSVECDDYHSMVYFILYLNCENYSKLLIYGDVVDIDVHVNNGHD